jgi:hypothetical protein
VRDRVKQINPDSWIIGHGWNQNQWGAYGMAKDLDRVAPKNPVYLTAKSLHAAWVNSTALQQAGIDASTPDPHGGEIQRDANGDPTGILFETAMNLVSKTLPKASTDELATALQLTQEMLWRYGITSVHDFDDLICLDALEILREQELLGIRVVKNIPLEEMDTALAKNFFSGAGDEWIRIGNLKIFTDGALGLRTAAMIEPYEGEPTNYGMLQFSQQELIELFQEVIGKGFALAVHAIGDQANHVTLNALEMLPKVDSKPGAPKMRHRIEHLQLLHPMDLARPAKLGIIPSMQPIHATSDMQMANTYWGPRIRYAYAWQSQIQSGATLAFGSDAPVESPNPFWGIHAAVTRKAREAAPKDDVWVPSERIAVHEAILAYTFGPAKATGLEHTLGSLKPGNYADLLLLDTDPYHCPNEKLGSIQPVGTMVGGVWRYRGFE